MNQYAIFDNDIKYTRWHIMILPEETTQQNYFETSKWLQRRKNRFNAILSIKCQWYAFHKWQSGHNQNEYRKYREYIQN